MDQFNWGVFIAGGGPSPVSLGGAALGGFDFTARLFGNGAGPVVSVGVIDGERTAGGHGHPQLFIE